MKDHLAYIDMHFMCQAKVDCKTVLVVLNILLGLYFCFSTFSYRPIELLSSIRILHEH